MTDLLDQARALEAQLRVDDAAVGDAPWNAPAEPSNTGAVLVFGVDGVPVAETSIVWRHLGPSEQELYRAQFIARTRNALPTIADTLRDLCAEVERLRKACNSARQRLLVASGFVDQKEVREAIGHSISLCDEAL